MDRIELKLGDITKLKVDAIVNAANAALCGGGGVDGAIHQAAGPELLAECRTLGRCETGFAVLTKGYRLAAAHVIHAVGPVWYGDTRNERELLASCYHESLSIARDSGLEQVAFPAISCGAYRFPVKEATEIACQVVRTFLRDHELPRRVIFCCFEHTIYREYERVLGAG